MELSNEPAGPVPPPLTGRKAGWWAWPLIVLCLIPFERWFAPEPVAKQEAVAVRETGSAMLALLKFQSQVVIATAKLDPAASTKALDDLGRTVSGNRGLAALALLESFVAPQSPRAGRVVERFTDRMPEELRSLVGQAVESGLAEPERDRLRLSLGWFAELARSPGLEAPPLEGEIRARALIVVAVIGLGFTVVAFGVLAGAALLVLHLRRTKADGLANAFVPVSRHGGVLLECFALHLGLMTLGAWLSPWLGGYSGIVGYGLAVVFPLVWARLRGVRWADFRAATGLYRGRGVWREIGAGCVGYLGVMAVASIGIGLTLLLTLVAGALAPAAAPGAGGGGGVPMPETHPIVGWLYEGNVWMRLACLGLAAGVAPLSEELFFRGALQRYFRGRFRFLSAALGTSLIFAALHPQGVLAIPALAGIGIGLSILREWRDSLIAPMTAHAINNGCLVLMLWWVL